MASTHTKPTFGIKGVFWFVFSWYTFLFIIFLIPLDLLFRITYLQLSFNKWELLFNLSLVILFFAFLSFLIASFSTFCAWITAFISVKAINFIVTLIFLLGCLFFSICFAQFLDIWIINAFGVYGLLDRLVLAAIILTVIFIFIIIFWKKDKFLEFIKSYVLAVFKFNKFILFISFILVLINISFGILNRINNDNYAKKTLKSAKPPNIIIIIFDSLAAGHTSLYGYKIDTTPNLIKLAQQSYVFQNMFASSNWTVPSIASLLTGKHPHHHKLNELYFSHFRGENKFDNLAHLLKKHGYKTKAIVGNPVAIPWRLSVDGFSETYAHFRESSPFHNAYQDFIPFDWGQNSKLITGFVRLTHEYGFQGSVWTLKIINTYLPFQTVDNLIKYFQEKVLQRSILQEKGKALRVFLPENLLGKAEDFLSRNQGPFFLWVHLWNPHPPYMPRNGQNNESLMSDEHFFEEVFNFYKGTHRIHSRTCRYLPDEQPYVDDLALQYDASISYVDRIFGNFLDFLKREGFLDDSIIIVTSDHGQMFERQFWSHGGPYLYQPLINIPLLIHLPGQLQGKKITSNASLVDLAPTILDFLDLTTPNWMDGQSLKNFLENDNLDSGPKLSMNLSFQNTPPDFKTFSVAYIKQNYKLIKYIQLDSYELYDLRLDPQEQHNLVQSQEQIFQSLKDEMLKCLLDYDGKYN